MDIITQYREKTKKAVLQRLDSLHSVETYLTNKSIRMGLAGFYKEVKNIGAGFPPTTEFNNSIPETLVKNVSDTCNACVKTSRMKSTIELALNHLKRYEVALKGNETEVKEESKSIHDLRPNT